MLNILAWEETLESLRKMPEKVHCDRFWQQKDYDWALSRIIDNLESDLQFLVENVSFIFDPKADREEQTSTNEALLRRWAVEENAPSLPSLCLYTIYSLGLELAPDSKITLMMAGLLGEIENNQPYHSNMHYRKVLLQLMRLIAAHNNMYKGTSRAFSAHQVVLLLIAVCIHDYGHDGKGNTVKGVFQQGRLEQRSFDWALPFLEACGMQAQADIDALRVMLLCTDVSPLGEQGNPMHQMKAAYRYHFHGGKKKTLTLGLDENLILLENNADLTLMSLILHEADIATSAGLTYVVTKYETAILGEEFGKTEMRPSDCLDFLERVCDRQFLSDAGQELYAANIARNCALAEDEIASGDFPLPVANKAVFLQEETVYRLVGKQETDGKTIN